MLTPEKLTGIIFLIVLFMTPVQAQVSVNWDHSYGGQGDETLVEILPLDNGDYLLAGNSVSPISGNKTAEPKGWMDYYVIRINAIGEIVWDQTYGGEKRDELTSVIQTADGNILLAGHSTSGISGNKSDANRGDADYWIVMIDPDGTVLWDRTYGGNRDDILQQVIEKPQGGYLLGGYSISGISGEKSEAQKRDGIGFHSRDLWIVSLDSEGRKNWDRTLGHNQQDIWGDMIVNFSGGISFVSITSTYLTKALTQDNSDVEYGYDELGRLTGDGYWLANLSMEGQLLEHDHFPRQNNIYPFKVISLYEIQQGELKFFAADVDWNTGSLIKTTYRYTNGIIEKVALSRLQKDVRDFDDQKVFQDGRINAYTLGYLGIATDGLVQIFQKDEDPFKIVLGGPKNERDLVISENDPDHFIVGMTSASSAYPEGFKTSEGYGGNDIWIVKFDSEDSQNEEKNWLLTLEGFEGPIDYYNPMHITPGVAEGVTVAIYTEKNAGPLKSNSDPGIWLMSVDNDGNMLWDNSIQTDQKRLVTELLTSNNEYYVSSVSPPDIEYYFISPESEYFLMKTDSEGNSIWEIEYPKSTSGTVEAITPAADGNGVVINWSLGSLNSNTSRLQCIDSDGKVKWTYEYPSKYNYSVIESRKDKGYIIYDYVGENLSFILLDEDGNEVWVVDSQNPVEGIVALPEFIYALDGTYYGSDSELWSLRLEQFDYEGHIIAYHEFPDFTAAAAIFEFARPDNGSVIFENIGSQYIELGPNLELLKSSSLYDDLGFENWIVNYSDASPMNQGNYVRLFYEEVESNYYLSAIPYAKIPLLSSIPDGDLTTSSDDIALYPNPAQDHLWIGNIHISPDQLEIRDLSGRIYKLTVQSLDNGIHVETSPLSRGIYLITIQLEDGIKSYRFIKN